MSYELDWSHDYCLYCDKQTSEGAYCSQACRVADRERSDSGSSYGNNYSLASSSSSSTPWHQSPHSTYSLYRTSSSARLQSTPSSPRTLNSHSGYHVAAAASSSPPGYGSQQEPPHLNTSSSQTSLSSTGSSAHSAATYAQLRDYTSAFDSSREWRRRQSST